ELGSHLPAELQAGQKGATEIGLSPGKVGVELRSELEAAEDSPFSPNHGWPATERRHAVAERGEHSRRLLHGGGDVRLHDGITEIERDSDAKLPGKRLAHRLGVGKAGVWQAVWIVRRRTDDLVEEERR